MNPREKLLAAVVGSLLLLLGGAWLVNQIDRAFSQRAGIRRQLEGQLAQKEQVLKKSRRASERLKRYEEMSLPSNPELARSQYQSWLSELVVTAELTDPQVKVISQTPRAGGHVQLTCSISGKGELDKIARLLYDFYAVNTLHRIRSLPLTPIADSKRLTTNMVIEALILPTAAADRDFDPSVESAWARFSREELTAPIIARNKFSPPNQPPRWGGSASRTVELGQTLSMQLQASDPDRLDRLSYRVAEGPDSVSLDRNSGQLQWRPRDVGEYEIVVEAADDGLPSLSSRQIVLVSVVEPPAPVAAGEEAQGGERLRFDDARFTYAIASLDRNGQRQIWLQIRTRGELLKLGEGDSLNVGSVSGVIARITAEGAVVRTADEELQIELGQPLVRAD